LKTANKHQSFTKLQEPFKTKKNTTKQQTVTHLQAEAYHD